MARLVENLNYFSAEIFWPRIFTSADQARGQSVFYWGSRSRLRSPGSGPEVLRGLQTRADHRGAQSFHPPSRVSRRGQRSQGRLVPGPAAERGIRTPFSQSTQPRVTADVGRLIKIFRLLIWNFCQKFCDLLPVPYIYFYVYSMRVLFN